MCTRASASPPHGVHLKRCNDRGAAWPEGTHASVRAHAGRPASPCPSGVSSFKRRKGNANIAISPKFFRQHENGTKRVPQRSRWARRRDLSPKFPIAPDGKRRTIGRMRRPSTSHAWAARDRLENLYRELAPAVLGYLRGSGAAEPEDLLGDVFVAVIRGLPNCGDDPAAIRRWVFTVAHHRLVDERRKLHDAFARRRVRRATRAARPTTATTKC